jgi:hypothetical protein
VWLSLSVILLSMEEAGWGMARVVSVSGDWLQQIG